MNNKLFTSFTIAFLFLSVIVLAQAPQAFSYQAIAANANGTPVANGTVAVRISVLDNSATGTVLYTETHSKQTNAQGLFNLNIGQGSPTTGTFSGINWGQNAKYVKVELDPAGGTNYVNVGTNQLMSVPYALYSEKTNEDNLSDAARGATSKNGKLIVVYTDTYAYGYNGSSGNWSTNTLSGGNVLGAVASDSAIVVYTSTYSYGYRSTGNWSTNTLSGGNVLGAVASGNVIVVYTSTHAYGYNGLSGNWSTNTLSGGVVLGTVVSGETIVVYTSTHSYGYRSSGNWSTNTLSGTVKGAIGN